MCLIVLVNFFQLAVAGGNLTNGRTLVQSHYEERHVIGFLINLMVLFRPHLFRHRVELSMEWNG